MEKKTLPNLLEGKLFKVPDYQRGYAWKKKQWNDFVQDIDSLVDENISSHYTGTIVIYKCEEVKEYGVDQLEVVDVVDGQQRLTTSILYLSLILRKLISMVTNEQQDDYRSSQKKLIFSGQTCKLTLNNETNNFYFELVSKGQSNVPSTNMHERNLEEGYKFFRTHIDDKLSALNVTGKLNYLTNLYNAITRKLHFSFYTIEVESEIGMTFELMNSRGKGLSTLELLKNYLMYWVYRNIQDEVEKKAVTETINKRWKEIYKNISDCNGNEDQCLRIAWTLACDHSPKNWQGYAGFKSAGILPLRNFSGRSQGQTLQFLKNFIETLATVSSHYSKIISSSTTCSREHIWLDKIKNTGNIANYLPLIVATRIQLVDKTITEDDYVKLLKTLEKFSYRIFLWLGKRSNTGISKFYRWGEEVFSKRKNIKSITEEVLGTLNWYSKEKDFQKSVKDKDNWYRARRVLKYTLFEYELHLLQTEGKNATPRLAWKDLSDATIEHILPQTQTELWKEKWSDDDIEVYLHDISNLVLTVNNSHYGNNPFEAKKGKAGEGYCYANSDIRQERAIAKYPDWTKQYADERRNLLEDWIIDRWGLEEQAQYKMPDETEADDDDLDVELIS